MQDSRRFPSTAEKAFQELKAEARKVLIANKTPIWNSESQQQSEEATLGNSEFSSSQRPEIKASCLPDLDDFLKYTVLGSRQGVTENLIAYNAHKMKSGELTILSLEAL